MEFEVVTGQQSVGRTGIARVRGGYGAEMMISQLNARYGQMAQDGRLFLARAVVTTPVIFTTAAGTGGPLIWNGSSNKGVRPIAISYAITTASGVVGAIGLTGGTGQSAAPSSTTAIDSSANMLLGGTAGAATAYRIGTVATAGGWFWPLVDVTTAATSVPLGFTLHDLGGVPYVPPNGGWVSVAASATLTSCVLQIGLLYEEVDHN